MTHDVFTEAAPALSPTNLRDLVREQWGLADPALRPLDSERDLNVLVDERFVLKVAKSGADVVDTEIRALAQVHAVAPGLPVPVVVAVRSDTPVVHRTDDTGRGCLAQLITLLPGPPLEGIPTGLAEQVGTSPRRMSLPRKGSSPR